MFTIISLAQKPTSNTLRHVANFVTRRNPQDKTKVEKLMFGGVIDAKKEKTKKSKAAVKETNKPQSNEKNEDTESYWLENLTAKEMKIYRKTSSGRYKTVDKEKVFDTVRNIIDGQVKKELAAEKVVLPEIIVKNLTSVPMLAPTKKEPEFIKPSIDVGSFPAVTRILTDTMSDDSKAALERWKQGLIAEIGLAGFTTLNRDQLSLGARFHNCLRQYLTGGKLVIDPDLQLVWHSVKGTLMKISDVQLVEANVAHAKLMYKGVVDCVASYEDVPSVIEWKVSQKPKNNIAATYDAPLQLAAYLGALSYDSEHRLNLRNGIIVIAYRDGSPADAFHMDEHQCLKSWSLWLKRLQLYWQNTNQVK